MVKAFSLKSETRCKYPFSPILFNIVQKVMVKLLLMVDYMIIFGEKSKEKRPQKMYNGISLN